MKTVFLLVSVICFYISSCSHPKNAQSMIDPSILNGAWEVVELPGSPTTLDVLYPQKKPSISFDVANQKISGSTSCNNYNGPFKAEGSQIDFSAPLGMTRMMCPGEGESTFVNTLQKVNGWTVREETLRLMTGDLVVMQLKRAIE